MQIFKTTERLILRELMQEDAAGMFELDADPQVHRYVGNKPIKTMDQASGAIEHIRRQYMENGIGRWAIEEKATGNFLGWGGLKLMRESMNGHINHYDLGYRFIQKYWGLGYATETAVATVDYGFEQMNLAEIFAIAHIENAGSDNVLRKAGLKHLGEFEDDHVPHKWYRILKEEWTSARSSAQSK
jgi:ribosomal-protein-alanine N-acetyltransferase